MSNISNNDIANAIYMGSADKSSQEMNAYSKNVVKFLARKRLLSKSSDILSRLQKIVNKKEKVAEAKVSSPTKLSTQTKHDLMHLLAKRYGVKEVILSESLDENLLGGIKIEVEDEVIDLTIKNKLNKLKTHLINA